MVKRKDFGDNQEFLKFNEKIINYNYFVFYASLMAMLSPSTEQIIRLYNLYDKNKNTLYCMWYSGNYVIQSLNWTNELIETLSYEIEFEKYRHFAFSGQRELIVKLLEDNEVQYKIIKDRLVYECNKVKLDDLPESTMGKAISMDLEKLSIMAYQYHLDEYGNQAYRSKEYMAEIIKNGIKEGNIYKLTVDGEICSMAQVISENFKSPLIGLLFTKVELRNKGYGRAIIANLTSHLLNNNHKKVGLLADINNFSSMKVFERAGYKSIYKHILVEIGNN